MKQNIATWYGIVLLCSTTYISAAIQEVKTIEEYRAVVGKSKPAIIKIYTDWCPNCVEMKDIFIATARDHGNEAVFVKVNAGTKDAELREILKGYASRGVPTFVLHPAGTSEQGVEKIVGARPEADFKDRVRQFLQKQSGRPTPTAAAKPIRPVQRVARTEEQPQPDVRKRRPARTCPTCPTCR